MRKSDLAHPLTGADDEHREALDTILRSLCDRTVEELVRDALNDELGDETKLQD